MKWPLDAMTGYEIIRASQLDADHTAAHEALRLISERRRALFKRVYHRDKYRKAMKAAQDGPQGP